VVDKKCSQSNMAQAKGKKKQNHSKKQWNNKQKTVVANSKTTIKEIQKYWENIAKQRKQHFFKQ
jgi:hypothetical protein